MDTEGQGEVDCDEVTTVDRGVQTGTGDEEKLVQISSSLKQVSAFSYLASYGSYLQQLL